MKWLEIGTILETPGAGATHIQLFEDYGKALLKLELFSHCLLYCLQEDRIDVFVRKIIEIKEDTGRLILESVHNNQNQKSIEIAGQLVDIKPYFPVEEAVSEAPEKAQRFCINYEGQVTGKYVLYGAKKVIQLDKHLLDESGKRIKALESIQVGDCLRILWWFDRFDKSAYRKTRTCKPPYNNAPRTGVFATRSPVRPNPLGATLVKVQSVDAYRGWIEIEGFDGFEGTQIFQIMHYQPSVDRVNTVTLPPWLSQWTAHKSFVKPKVVPSLQKDRRDRTFDGDFNQSFTVCEALETETTKDEVSDINVIEIHNARIHNLKNVSVTFPKNSVVLITGVSGSGKSSLAFDTVYAESQRTFMDLVLSNQMSNMALYDIYVDKITGLQPSIAIKQQGLGANPRSTVGSVTKIADILKTIFATIGTRVCPSCQQVVDESNVCANCGHILFDRTPQIFSYNHPDYMCPVCKGLGIQMQVDESKIVDHPEKSLLDSASTLYGNLRKHREKPNANWMRGEILALANDLKVDLEQPFNQLPEIFRQQFFQGSNGREVSLSYETSKGRSGTITRPVEGAVHLVQRLVHEGKSPKSLEQVKRYMSETICNACQGERLLEEGRLVHISGDRYPEVTQLSVNNLRRWCHSLFPQLGVLEQEKTRVLFRKVNNRLKRIQDVGLGYITLDRSVPSLSGGEAQRLKLATQFGTGLSNILYIMDEPSKGLHPKDYKFLMDAILDLKKQGNTVIVVEHKKIFLTMADHHIHMGPKAGQYGGEVVSVQDRAYIEKEMDLKAYTEDFSSIKLHSQMDAPCMTLKGVATNNLKNISVNIPLGKLTSVIGVSGSGKSSLISKTLYPYVLKSLGRFTTAQGQYTSIAGADSIKDISFVSQKPIGSNSRSTPGTYTGVFDNIRKCYAKLEASKEKGFTKDYFSFNSKKGQCPECGGLGEIAVNMHYTDDIYVACSKCQGRRYNKEVLEIKRNGLSISDILDREVVDLLEIFKAEKDIFEQLQMLEQVGLGYLKLGQNAATLSGGEAQRIKLAKELYKTDCNHVLYILDEPTTGLHEDDIEKIIGVLEALREKGATIVVIEHHLSMIKASDYVVELGPSGGDLGGYILQEGYQEKTNAVKRDPSVHKTTE